MKKLLSLLLCLMLLLPAASLAEEGWFANAQLTEEEQQLLGLLHMDEDYGPYEFKAPVGANYITLIVWEFLDGQWVEFSDFSKELPQVSPQTSVTLTATQQEDGTWSTEVRQPRVGADRPDGRIYTDGYDLPDHIWLVLQLPGNDYPRSVGIYKEEEIDLSGLDCMRRTFLYPEQKGYLQQKAVAILNEPTLLELYVCTREQAYSVPDFSEFNTPEAFAEFDYAFAVTVTFSAEPLS